MMERAKDVMNGGNAPDLVTFLGPRGLGVVRVYHGQKMVNKKQKLVRVQFARKIKEMTSEEVAYFIDALDNYYRQKTPVPAHDADARFYIDCMESLLLWRTELLRKKKDTTEDESTFTHDQLINTDVLLYDAYANYTACANKANKKDRFIKVATDPSSVTCTGAPAHERLSLSNSLPPCEVVCLTSYIVSISADNKLLKTSSSTPTSVQPSTPVQDCVHGKKTPFKYRGDVVDEACTLLADAFAVSFTVGGVGLSILHSPLASIGRPASCVPESSKQNG
jgi:hypothetical protein